MSYSVLRQAILERHALTAHYDYFIRYFCPFSLGFDEGGDPIAIAFQYGGGKPEGLRPGGEWIAYKVDGLQSIQSIGDPWRIGKREKMPTGIIVRLDVSADTP
jgi:hypothetical protein